VVAGLRSMLGPGRVFDHGDILARRSLDTWPLPLVQQVVGREPPVPSCVVRPGSTEEVSRALAYLTGSGIPVVPYGGGSGVQGGAAPPPGAVVIDLCGLDEVRGRSQAFGRLGRK
jgi:alkyldihydroxyacetonephosphate synthase